MDWFVVISPLAVLGIVLLLGFAGCDLVFKVRSPLALRIRVPSGLTILDSRLSYIEPGSTAQVTVTGLSGADDGSGVTVLEHVIASPAEGGWEVDCGLRVSDGVKQAAASVDGVFTLTDEDSGGTATFEASGAPATLDFTIVFTGFVQNG